ncbi:protein of unknown function (plasmid) [Caballeronia sp. S22]
MRRSWATLHALQNRRQAPPPVLLMFVVSGDFEAVAFRASGHAAGHTVMDSDLVDSIVGDADGNVLAALVERRDRACDAIGVNGVKVDVRRREFAPLHG